MRSATSFALERYVDAAILDGWAPGGARRSPPPAADDDADGLLEVAFDDLVRALREASPSGRGRAGGARALERPQFERGRSDGRRRRRDVRHWWRERRLRMLTERALLEAGAS